MREEVKRLLRPIYPLALPAFSLFHRHFLTPWNIRKNKGKSHRMLEIGPGPKRLKGFESLNVVAGVEVDYVWDASRHLPFQSETFDLIYASHVLEHVPWYQTQATLNHWVRALKSGGKLEIWIPDGLKIARTFVLAEEGEQGLIQQDGWYKFNDDHDACTWANGRIYSYGDGTGKKDHPNWHLSLLSERRLKKLLAQSGLVNLEIMTTSEVRGYDHGWINLGMRGVKP